VQSTKNPAGWTARLENFPFLLPYVDELRSKTIVHFGPGRGELVEKFAQSAGASAVTFDPDGQTKWTAAKACLLVSIDFLDGLPAEDIDPTIAQMAACAKQAIIVIDLGHEDLLAPETLHDQDWWAERLGAYYPYLEPIRVRSKRRAAFKTWKSNESRQLLNFVIFVREELKYKWRKIRGA
jgi:hypothetical protein